MCSSSSVLTVSLCLLLCLPPCLSSDDPQEVKVKPGEDATLPCRSSRDAKITLIHWIRPDLTSEGYIFLYKDSQFNPDSLHRSYCGRVKLKDPEMKDGDVSVVLKNVTFNDAGRYECVVGNTGSKPELSNITLKVQDDIIRVKPGQSVSLPCRAPSNTDITGAEWTGPGLEPGYVFLYRDGKPDPDNQHPSYQNRVELKDREMKDGDVSMILKEVTKDDSGTYECRVFYKETTSSSGSSSGLFSIVHLQVHQSGDTEERGDKDGGNKDLYIAVALFVVAVVVVGGFIFYRKRRKPTEQSSPPVGYKAAETGPPADPAERVEIHEPDPGSEGLEEPGPQTQDQL